MTIYKKYLSKEESVVDKKTFRTLEYETKQEVLLS